MRHLAQSWLFKGLMLILIISFGIWGIGDMFRGNPLQRTVAKAGNASITVQTLNREFEQTLGRARQMFGSALTADEARQYGMLDKALDGLIDRAIMDQEIKRLGINVSEKAVLERLAAQPQFRDKDGKFNRALFQQILAQARLNESDFLLQGREDLGRRQIIDTLSDNGSPPSAIVDAVYNARAQKRILDVVTLKNESIVGIPEPEEKTLREFYEKNSKLFTAPEYRAITIARLSTDDIMKDVTISDDQVQKQFDATSEKLMQPERRDILQVVMQDQDKANDLAAAAKESGDLVLAAKAHGYDTVSLNKANEGSLLQELATPVFALQLGQVSGPLKSSLGWHVLQVKKIYAAGKPALADVQEDLRQSMTRDQAIEAATRITNQLDDELAANHSLDDIADTLKLRLIKIPALDLTGKTPEGKDPPEMPFKAALLKAAFAQSSGETSPVMDDKNGNYFVVRTDEITASAVKPFAQILDDVGKAWLEQEKAKRAMEESDKIAAAMREGKAASSFAGERGIDVRVSKPVSLIGDKDPALPTTILPQIFRMKKGDVITSVQPGQQFILRLAETIDELEHDESGHGKVLGDLSEHIPTELVEEYIQHLRATYPIEINREVLESVMPQRGG
jgi:peptidyl-prolyl cis-trans isomerase D